jgi:glycosyltransferase involved in cell wall biosynthesis
MRSAGHQPLTVVHVVVTNAFAGVERYVCQVVNELAARGHRVTTIGGDSERMRTELDEDVSSRSADSLLAAAMALARFGRPDIVHVHMTSAEGAAWLAHPWQRAPRVATRHFARHRGSSAINRVLSRITSRGIARDIAISRFVADSIGTPSVLIPNGVPDRPQAPLESPVVLMLQRLNSEKAPDVGIRAWSASGLGHNGWRLLVAGGGLQGSLAQLAHDLGIGDSVEFLGQVTATDDLLARASILVAPAPEEPFGLSVVEAMAHGIPVVGAPGGAPHETVADRGVLFTSDDPKAAGEALAELGASRPMRLRMGHDLRLRQQEMYSLSTHVDRLEALYDDLVGAAEGRRQPAS